MISKHISSQFFQFKTFFEKGALYFASNVKGKKGQNVQKIIRRETLEDQLINSKNNQKESNVLKINPIKQMNQSVQLDQTIAINQKVNKNENKQKNLNFITENKAQILKNDHEEKLKIVTPNEKKIEIPIQKKIQDINSIAFPWDFNGSLGFEKEKNLLTAMDLGQIINEKQSLQYLKNFLSAIEEADTELLEDLLEKKFAKKLSNLLQTMNDESFQIQFKNTRSKNISVNLFEVRNIFAVGVDQNRRKNDTINSYVVFEDFIGENIPAQHIVIKSIQPKEIARIFVQLHLSFESPISLSFTQNKISNSGFSEQTRSDQIGSGKKEKQHHVMILEKLIMECDYKSFRNQILESSNDSSPSKNKQSKYDITKIEGFKNLSTTNSFKIIDFDNFMKGNPLVLKQIEIE